jgi:hypothetical protein
MVTDEDVAHIAVRLPKEKLPPLIDQFFLGRGYRRVPLKGMGHLLGEVNWASPFHPPAKQRCLMLIPDQGGWSTVVDMLDHLDMELAESLSMSGAVIAIRGYHELQEFEYLVLVGGKTLTDIEVPDHIAEVVQFIRTNPDHVTKFRYDELCLSLPEKVGGVPIDCLGYSLL